MKIHKSKILFIFSFMVLLINWACVKNPCENIKKESPYFLSDITKAYISNYIGAKNIIFTNKSNEEIIFKVSEITDSMVSYSKEITCEEDSSKLQSVEGESQFIELSLSNPLFEKPFIINLVELPQKIEDEKVLILFGELSDSTGQGDILMVHYTLKDLNYTTIRDSIVLDNKVFYNVIENLNWQTNPKFEIKYNKNQGIIYIKEKSTNKEYFYKRKE